VRPPYVAELNAASSVVAGVTLAHDDLLLSPLLRDFARYLAHHAWGKLNERVLGAGRNLAMLYSVTIGQIVGTLMLISGWARQPAQDPPSR
jgi:hypothetical protein